MIFKKITKKALSLILLALITAGQNSTKCMSYLSEDQLKKVLGTTAAFAAATTCSTIYCWYKKRQLSKELENLRSGNVQKENDQKLLIEIGKYIDEVNQKFEPEIILAKSKSNLYQEEHIERWINIAKQKRSMVQSIKIAHDALSTYKKDLELRISEWNRANLVGSYISKGKELYKDLASLESIFNDMSSSVKSQLNFIDLSLLMDRDSLSVYSSELELSKHFAGQQYISELDKIVRSKLESNNPFPYLTYASKLRNNIDNINNVLERLKGSRIFVFQERVIIQAKELTMALSHLLENIVSISSYQHEQVRKPEYDKQQKLLAAELKEREEKILREKQLVETNLIHEKNKEQKLANERAKIERDRQALIVQERNMIYEIEKLRNGQALKEELAKETSKNEKLLKAEIDKAKAEVQKDLNLKEQELNSIKYSMQSLDNQKRQTDNRLNQVYSNIAVCKQYIKNLQDKLSRPPCNPEAVDGLKDYLATLNNLSRAAIEAV